MQDSYDFTSRGFLHPSGSIEFEPGVFKKVFVDQFPESNTRELLYEGYLRYTHDFTSLITDSFIQWIGGSFTTTKRNPRDIDLVTFIPERYNDVHKELIANRFRFDFAKKTYGVDGYSVPVYPTNHAKFGLTKEGLLYWDRQFSRSRLNRAKQTFS